MVEGKYKSLADIPPDWKPTGAGGRSAPPPPPKRRWEWWVGGAAIAVIVAVGGVAMVWQKSVAPATAGAATPGAVVGDRSRAAARSAEAIAASLDSARKLMKERQWPRAEAVLTAATGQFPDDQELRVALAEALLGQDKHGAAYEQYEKALAIGPRDPRLEFIAAQTASAAGRMDRAIEHYSVAQAADPKNATIPLMLGMAQRQAGQVDAAKASLLRAANMDSGNAFAWGSLADIALGENNVGLALQHVAKARQIQPQSKEWRLIEARALTRKGDPERALLTLRGIDASQLRDVHVLRLMAQCYGMIDRPQDAAALWAGAVEAEPDNAEFAFEAAAAADRMGDRARAVELARLAKMLGHEGASKLLERWQAADAGAGE